MFTQVPLLHCGLKLLYSIGDVYWTLVQYAALWRTIKNVCLINN
jgi:hypothetical protein